MLRRAFLKSTAAVAALLGLPSPTPAPEGQRLIVDGLPVRWPADRPVVLRGADIHAPHGLRLIPGSRLHDCRITMEPGAFVELVPDYDNPPEVIGCMFVGDGGGCLRRWDYLSASFVELSPSARWRRGAERVT